MFEKEQDLLVQQSRKMEKEIELLMKVLKP